MHRRASSRKHSNFVGIIKCRNRGFPPISNTTKMPCLKVDITFLVAENTKLSLRCKARGGHSQASVMFTHKSSRDVVVARVFPISWRPVGSPRLHQHVHDFPRTHFAMLGRSSRQTRIGVRTRRKRIPGKTCDSIYTRMTCTFTQALPTMRKPQCFGSDLEIVS